LKNLFLFLLLLLFIGTGCQSEQSHSPEEIIVEGKGGLLTTQFESLDDLKSIVKIEYSEDRESWVKLTHSSNSQQVESILESGVSEKDIVSARDGSIMDKLKLSYNSPFFVANRKDLLRVYGLSRRIQWIYGEGDITFFDLASTMVKNINAEDTIGMSTDDLSEKGYLNTFNHINSQAFMTILFSEDVADFVADAHERRNMPELISGKFTEQQIKDIKFGPVDNYVDMINNEWGQELGKYLKNKYKVDGTTIWTIPLMIDLLNDMQVYYSWVFEIGFSPFRSHDQLVERLVFKINSIMNEVGRLN